VTEPRGLFSSLLASGQTRIGQIEIRQAGDEFVLCHRDDVGADALRDYPSVDAWEIARFDDAGNYRPLKTAPNLRHGWRVVARDLTEMERVIEAIYPGRLAILRIWESGQLETTSWRKTLQRQSGMYRVAARISAAQSDQLIGTFCRSQGGCLRTILWNGDESGGCQSTELPKEKYDPDCDQTGRAQVAIPLLCQEPCNLLVAAARKLVKGEP
jgi:sirohydrochlorin cobaltochelatase